MDENVNPPRNNELKKFSLSDALVIAIVPIIAYMIIYAYDYGLLNAFKLPLRFITFDTTEIFVVIGGLLFFVVIGFLIWDSLYGLMPPSRIITPETRRNIAQAIPVYTFLLLFLLLYSSHSGEPVYKLFVGFILIYTVYAVVIPILKSLYHPKTRVRIEKVEKIKETVDTSNPIGKLVDYIGLNAFKGLVALLAILLFAYNAGRVNALDQKYYRVLDTKPEMVVLYQTSDSMIVSPFNRQTKLVEPSFRVIEIKSNPDITYTFQNIGPLTLDEKAIGDMK